MVSFGSPVRNHIVADPASPPPPPFERAGPDVPQAVTPTARVANEAKARKPRRPIAPRLRVCAGIDIDPPECLIESFRRLSGLRPSQAFRFCPVKTPKITIRRMDPGANIHRVRLRSDRKFREWSRDGSAAHDLGRGGRRGRSVG